VQKIKAKHFNMFCLNFLCGLVEDIGTAVLESDHDYTLNIPEFIDKKKPDP